MAKKGKMTEEEKAKLPEAFRENFGRIRELPTEVAREMSAKGNESKAEKERQITLMREALRLELGESALLLLNAEMLEGLRAVFSKFNLPIEKGTNLMGILMGLMKRAQQGDPTAAKAFFEIAGIFTETKNLNITGNMPTTAKGDTLYEANSEDNG